MRITSRSLIISTVLPLVLGFRDSSPLLIWSKRDSAALKEAQSEITSGIINADEIYGTLHTLGCDWSKILVVSNEDLHQSHIPSLNLQSPADLHVPYLVNPSAQALDSVLESWLDRCTSGSSGDGKQIIKSDESSFDPYEADITIFTGTRLPTQNLKRQEPDEPERPFPSRTSASSTSSTSTSKSSSTSSHKSGSHNSTIPTDGPLLDRVQLLTTPIITALLISFLIFVPIVMMGVSALAGIQVPPRMMEIGKGMIVGKEKKDQ